MYCPGTCSNLRVCENDSSIKNISSFEGCMSVQDSFPTHHCFDGNPHPLLMESWHTLRNVVWLPLCSVAFADFVLFVVEQLDALCELVHVTFVVLEERVALSDGRCRWRRVVTTDD